MNARKLCAKLPPDTRALMHTALNGAFWTEDHLHHIAEADKPLCKWCNQRDGCHHRIWDCPHFSLVREQVCARHPSAACITQPGCLPECQAQHAWPCEPPELRQLWRQLLQIPDVCHVHQPVRSVQVLHLFTDGACMLPHTPQLRLASWAVCQAVEPGQVPVLLAGGPLSGLIQTAFRAEMSAVLPCWIYCDCQGVVDRVLGFLQGLPGPSGRGRNSDLWQRIHDAVKQAGNLLRSIIKVPAHQNSALAPSCWEAWLWSNNHLVDRAADAMNGTAAFLQLWDRVRKGWVLESLRADFVFDLHKSVAVHAVSSLVPERIQPETIDLTGLSVLSCPVVSNEELHGVAVSFGFQFCQVLANWIRLQCHGGVGQQPRWISLLQMLVLFHRDTGLRPPLYHQRTKRWVLPGVHPEAAMIEVDTARRVQWWRHCLKTLLRSHGSSPSMHETRPYSSVLLLRLPSVLVTWDNKAFDTADELLLAKTGQTCSGRSRLWARTGFL